MVLTGYVTGSILVIKCLIITLNFIFSYGSHRFDHGAYSSCESERGLQLGCPNFASKKVSLQSETLNSKR